MAGTKIELTEKEIALASGDREGGGEVAVSGAEQPELPEKPEHDEEQTTEVEVGAAVNVAGDPENAREEAAEEESPESTDTEEESTDETAESDEGGEESDESEESTEESWLTDDLKELAQSYGFSDEDIGDFRDEAELRRAGKMLDKQFVAALPQEKEPEKKPEKKAEPAAEKKDEPESDVDLFDPQVLEDADYDTDVVNLGKSYRKTQEQLLERDAKIREMDSQLKEMATAQQQFQDLIDAHNHDRDLHDFHSAADSLNEKLFGKVFDENGLPGDLDQRHDDNRQKLWDAESTIVSGIIANAERAGVEPKLPSPKALAMRAYQMAFPDEIVQTKKTGRVAAARRQSARRRTVGSQAAAKARHNPNSDDPKDIANDPRIKAFWDQAEEANGSR